MEVEYDVVTVEEFDALLIEAAQQPPAPRPWTAPKEKYPAKLHARKVAQKLGRKDGLIYLPGEPAKIFEDSDMGPSFRQRRYFYYLAGTDFENCAVTYDLAKDLLVLWIPYSDPKQLLWFGRYPSPDECRRAADVDDVRFVSGLGSFLESALLSRQTLFVLHEDQIPAAGRGRHADSVDTRRLQPAMDAARVVKDGYEIALVRRANAVSSAAHRRVLEGLRAMANEREIEAVFRAHCMAAGAHRQAYPVIAGSGANAGVLHYFANNEPLAGRQLVCLDAGAEWHCYASDVTRTFPVSGAFSPEAAAVYAVVERMQAECIARVRPGAEFRALQDHAMALAVDGLLALGILRAGSAADILAAGTAAAFFPHGLGHHVGLEVHDVAPLSAALVAPVPATPWDVSRFAGKRRWMTPRYARVPHVMPTAAQQKLEPGMIITIEPGIYFCPEYISAFFLADPVHAQYIDTSRLETYYPVGGVRIEDDILVTAEGYENLTTAPKGEEMLKIINGL